MISKKDFIYIAIIVALIIAITALSMYYHLRLDEIMRNVIRIKFVPEMIL